MANWTRDDSRSRSDQVLEDMGLLDSPFGGDGVEYRDFNYDPQRNSNPRSLLVSCCVLSLALLPVALIAVLWRLPVKRWIDIKVQFGHVPEIEAFKAQFGHVPEIEAFEEVQRVQAEAFGALAVHLGVQKDGDKYVITHIPTGRKIVAVNDCDTARALCAELAEIRGWETVKERTDPRTLPLYFAQSVNRILAKYKVPLAVKKR